MPKSSLGPFSTMFRVPVLALRRLHSSHDEPAELGSRLGAGQQCPGNFASSPRCVEDAQFLLLPFITCLPAARTGPQRCLQRILGP